MARHAGLFIDDSRIAEHIGPAIGIADDDRVLDIGSRLAIVIDSDAALVAVDIEAQIFLAASLELDILDEEVRCGVQRNVDFRRALTDRVLDIAIAFVAAGILVAAILHG
jgi:hypothetical protein